MRRPPSSPKPMSEAAIFGRLLNHSRQHMTPSLAKYVLSLGFDAAEQDRMRLLAERNQQASLSAGEHDELVNYIRAGHLLALLHSQARRASGLK